MKDFKIPDWVQVSGGFLSAVALAVIFLFTNFQTKTEANVNAEHVKESQDSISRSVEKMDSKIEKINDKLDRLILLQRSK